MLVPLPLLPPEVKNADRTGRPSLAERLRSRIRAEGPITFRDWMDAALYDETEGYYCRHDRTRWGRAGDYRTSPERTPLFSATFARYFAKLYEQMSAPSKWTILEAGAGGGHFARGLLTTLENQYPQVFAATDYLIDEKSNSLRSRLRESIQPFEDKVELVSLNEIQTPIQVGIIFSNELLDAMPVHRVVMRDGKLKEVCVTLDEGADFIWVEIESTNPRITDYFNALDVTLSEGQFAEVNLAAGDWLRNAASKLERGYIITIDYGAESTELYDYQQRPDGTLRAFQRHRFADNVLSQPGMQDITTTINWTHIRQEAIKCGLENVRFERQDRFLIEEGVLDQLGETTGDGSRNAEAILLRTEARELVLPSGMSASFQVLVSQRNLVEVPRPLPT
jgi:SAM-dependent MidA family methyltransferase